MFLSSYISDIFIENIKT